MITLQELCCYLNDLLQPSLFPDYCINGLQVEGASQISSLAFSVSASLDAIEQAASLNAQALLVHHGLFWKGDSHEILDVKRKKLAILLKNEISLIAYHLPLDAHLLYGNNWKVAHDLGWTNLRPFGSAGRAPVGVIGEFPSISCQKFVENLEKYYGRKAHLALGGKKEVTSCALISGGAHKNITDAVKEKADCFVTGSFDEPIWHLAFEKKINFMAFGHSDTEKVGVRALADHLKTQFDLACTYIDTANPF